MMDKKGLTATNFLKSTEMRDKYECGICYEVCTKPVRCRGQCSKIFCMKCVSDIRQEVDRCPYKCSQPFFVERIPDIHLEFYCPYNPSECKAQIKSLRSFDDHYHSCQYVSPEQLYRKQMQQKYKCLNGHQLQFFVGSYEQMLESICIACRQERLCRSFCRICDHFYCVACRVPPCAKEGCPIGHTFSFQRIANLNFICDICGVSTAVSNDGVYDDSLCNFGICEGCYSELPEKFDQSKPRELIANINTLCSCGYNLKYVNAVHQTSACSLCTKLKECPKYCSNCQKYYCLSCKIIDINLDGTCGMDHQISSYGLAGVQQFVQKQKYFGCMKCGKSEQQYYYDQECRTRLCSQCISYCKKVTADKTRPIITKCEKNHVLMYLAGSEDWYDLCSQCHQEKIIKLRCMYCQEDGLSYCFECKPIPLQTCYYKHQLRFAKFQSERECHFCRKNANQFHYCKKCYFFVCKECVEANLQEKCMDMQQQLQKIEKKQSWSTLQKMQDCKHEEDIESVKFDEEM